MEIARYEERFFTQMTELFERSVREIACRDYSEKECEAWAPHGRDYSAWRAEFRGRTTLLAFDAGLLVGFGDMTDSGYLDRLYVMPGFEGKGIGRALVMALESLSGSESFSVRSSITAEPFFRRLGYVKVRDCSVERSGVVLRNCLMEKHVT